MCFRDVFLSVVLAVAVGACPPDCACTGVVLQCTGDIPALSNTSSMEVLNISHGSIPVLMDDVFSSYPQLTQIDLTFDGITKVEPLAFRGLWSLAGLRLSHNRIKSLAPDVFEDCVALRYLDLSYNPLASASTFINVPSLTTLVLRACGLRALFLSGVPRLESLDVGSNNLTYLAPQTFWPLHNLTHLEIGNNPWPCNDSTWTLVCWSSNLSTSKRPPYCFLGGSRHRLSSVFRDKTCQGVNNSVIEHMTEHVTEYTHTPTEIFIASTLAVMIVVILLFFVGTRLAWFTNCCVPLRMFVYRSLRSDGH